MNHNVAKFIGQEQAKGDNVPTLVLRHNTVGNFEVERPDNSVIGAVWCRVDNKWMFHLYNNVEPDRTEDERRQIRVILENLNGAIA